MKEVLDNPVAPAYDARMNPTDNFDQTAFDALPEDFDSAPLWGDPDHGARQTGLDYLDQMWSRKPHGAAAGLAKDAITAHRMVQTFVNAFARGGHYRVTFDESIGTAGTNLDTRDVLITPAPVLDPRIDAQRAGRVLTGLSCHEISHPRYDEDTSRAVKAVFSSSYVADHLSNVLSDVRIERRFVGDYPGYEGIFEPTLEYVAQSMTAKEPSGKITPTLTDQTNLMTLAVRYADYADWSDPALEAERVWWSDWRDRWAHEDSPRRHVAAIREGLRHIIDTSQSEQKKEREVKGQPEPSWGNEGAPAPGSQKDEEDLRAGSAKGLGQQADDADRSDNYRGRRNGESRPDPSKRAPTCAGTKAVDKASGVPERAIDAARGELQREVTQGEEVVELPDGTPVDVAVSTRELEVKMDPDPMRSPEASRPIRDALLRSRTGHVSELNHQKRGRLDQRGLHRIAVKDHRVFEKKRSTSPGKYLVWLMLDTSSSMDAHMAQTAQVATAIADATQHVPTVRAAAWAWSSSYRGRGMAGVAKLWQSGQPTAGIAKVVRLKRGGTPDAPVLRWATEAILRDARNGETPVIIFCSDGEGQPTMPDAVEAARARGIDVRSVALGKDLDAAAQRRIYGEGNFIPWAGNILATARPLATMIARIVSTTKEVRR